MKRYNHFYIFIITILFLSTNLIKSMIKTLPPIPLENSASYNGGICFANSALQCLLQIPNFLEAAKSSKLKELTAFTNQLKEDKNSNAWELVQHIYAKNPSHFGVSYFFIQKLIKVIGCENTEFRYQSERDDIFKIQETFEENESIAVSLNYGKPISATKNHFNSDIVLNAIPELQTLIARPQAKTAEEFNRDDLSKLINDEANSFNQTWLSMQPDRRARSSFELKGILVTVTIAGTGHGMSYVKNNGIWFKCDDSRITGIYGGIEEVKDQIYLTRETPIIIVFEQHYSDEPTIENYEQDRTIQLSELEFERDIDTRIPRDKEVEKAIEISLKELFDKLEISEIDDILKMRPFIENKSKLDELYEILLEDSSLKYEETPLLNENGVRVAKRWFLNELRNK